MPLHVFYTIICNENYLTSVETVSGHDLATNPCEKRRPGASVDEHFSYCGNFSKCVTPLSSVAAFNVLNEANWLNDLNL